MPKPLRNLGPKSLAMLERAGIVDAAQLRALGAARAYLQVRRRERTASLNLLWALEGALSDRPWQDVAKHYRLSLLLQVEALEKDHPGG
jgi:DNA transformation protein and related proteins